MKVLDPPTDPLDDSAHYPLCSLFPMQKSIISHFSDPNAKGFEQWLLFAAKAIEKVDIRVCRIWQALGVTDVAAVLEAIKCWTEAKRIPQYGLEIPGTNLKVFRSSRGEGHGTDARYLAFGFNRPKLSVDDTYLCGAVQMEARLPESSGRRRRRSQLSDSEDSRKSNVFYGSDDELEWKSLRGASVDHTRGSSAMCAVDLDTGVSTSTVRYIIVCIASHLCVCV